MNLQDQLAKAAKDLRLKEPVEQTSAPQGTVSANRPKYHSTHVRSKKRAGRAPYNFVPLPETVHWYVAPPPGDRFHPQDMIEVDTKPRYSGYIDLDFEALSRFYVRGMRTLAEYKRDSEQDRLLETRLQRPLPFTIHGDKLAIPGSSLRGMIRSLVEILGASPLDPINGHHQLFFRAVAADDNPKARSFDPSAVAYKKRLAGGRGTRVDPAYPRTKAGYLTGSPGDWKIVPAARPEWYRIEYSTIEKEGGSTEASDACEIWFSPPENATLDEYHSHRETFFSLPIVTEFCRSAKPGYQKGCLMRSGHIVGKYMHWIIGPKGSDGPITMRREDVDAYLLDQQRHARSHLKYSDQSKNLPCFFIEWEDFQKVKHVSIGHTGYFRLPYEKLVGMANPSARASNETRWDLAQAIFGRTNQGAGNEKRTGAATRIYFEDAISSNSELAAQVEAVLATPKLTTYENYLVQEDDSLKNSIHWDGQCVRTGDISEVQHPEKAIIRGTKRYFHRGDNAPITPPKTDEQGDTRKSTTVFRPAPKETKLVSRIRFSNLDSIELGAMLTALDLPENHAHSIGMAKPLGFGSIRIEPTLTLIDRLERYSGFFIHEGDQVRIRTGASVATADEVLRFKAEFAHWILPEADRNIDLWTYLDSPNAVSSEARRLKELKALLRFGPKAGESWINWQNATRYLELGSFKLLRNGEGRPYAQHAYNEFKHVGYSPGWNGNPPNRPSQGWSPDPTKPKRPGDGPPIEARRPLPPASQVSEMDDKIPTDPRPDFGDHSFPANVAPHPLANPRQPQRRR